MGAWTSGPAPADQGVSVAVSRKPTSFRAEGRGGGQRGGAPAGGVVDRPFEAAAPPGQHRDRAAGTELLQGQVGGDVPDGPAPAQ